MIPPSGIEEGEANLSAQWSPVASSVAAVEVGTELREGAQNALQILAGQMRELKWKARDLSANKHLPA